MRYVAFGWSGYVPAACRGNMLFFPINVAPWLWGWPGRFVQRLKSTGAELLVGGPWDGGFSRGIDDAATFARMPADYAGGIRTNRLDRIAPLVRLHP